MRDDARELRESIILVSQGVRLPWFLGDVRHLHPGKHMPFSVPYRERVDAKDAVFVLEFEDVLIITGHTIICIQRQFYLPPTVYPLPSVSDISASIFATEPLDRLEQLLTYELAMVGVGASIWGISLPNPHFVLFQCQIFYVAHLPDLHGHLPGDRDE